MGDDGTRGQGKQVGINKGKTGKLKRGEGWATKLILMDSSEDINFALSQRRRAGELEEVGQGGQKGHKKRM